MGIPPPPVHGQMARASRAARGVKGGPAAWGDHKWADLSVILLQARPDSTERTIFLAGLYNVTMYSGQYVQRRYYCSE